MYLMIDLYAGLGGASQAFVDDEAWTVLQYDNNPELLEFNPDLIMMDLSNKYNVMNDLLPRLDGSWKKIVIWASPPCLEFSLAYNAPRIRAHRAGIQFNPDLTHMLNSQWIIKLITEFAQNADVTWVIENVRGAIKDFEPYLGNFVQSVNAIFLWGNFGQLILDQETKNHKKLDSDGNRPRENVRAKIPEGISLALKKHVTNQKRITSYQ